jgi:hypothetical protein
VEELNRLSALGAEGCEIRIIQRGGWSGGPSKGMTG